MRAGWARGVMQEWVSTALHVSKEIRNTARPFLKEQEIEDLCISYLQAKRSDLGSARILVLGSGVVGSTIVEKLVRMGLGCDWCYHIKRPELPESWAGKVALCTFDDLRGSLSRADVIVCATYSPHLVLTQGARPPLRCRQRSVLIVDLTMPRNVDPALDGLRRTWPCRSPGSEGVVAGESVDMGGSPRIESPDRGRAQEICTRNLSEGCCLSGSGASGGPFPITYLGRRRRLLLPSGVEDLRGGLGEHARLRLCVVPGPKSFDRVAGERERRAGEANTRRGRACRLSRSHLIEGAGELRA